MTFLITWIFVSSFCFLIFKVDFWIYLPVIKISLPIHEVSIDVKSIKVRAEAAPIEMAPCDWLSLPVWVVVYGRNFWT